MKILITNQYLVNRAGSELFTLELAEWLSKAGHQVYIYTIVFTSEVVEPARRAGVSITDDIATLSSLHFDVIHAQHRVVALMARSVFKSTPLLYMVHGVLPRLEQPPKRINAHKYIAVSNEVKEHLVGTHAINAEDIIVVHNFVDTSRFYPTRQAASRLATIVVVSNHYIGTVRNRLQQAARIIGAKVVHVGLPQRSTHRVERAINEADLVVTLGRGVLEAIACGRRVLVYDVHGCDGMVTHENFSILRSKNFSGRVSHHDATVSDLVTELRAYDSSQAEGLRALVIAQHSKEVIIPRIVALYTEAVAEGCSLPQECISPSTLRWMLWHAQVRERIKRLVQYSRGMLQ